MFFLQNTFSFVEEKLIRVYRSVKACGGENMKCKTFLPGENFFLRCHPALSLALIALVHARIFLRPAISNRFLYFMLLRLHLPGTLPFSAHRSAAATWHSRVLFYLPVRCDFPVQ